MVIPFFVLWYLSQFNVAQATPSPQVDTTSGSVQGFVSETAPNVAQFLGIPFAEKPVGPRRWLPPLPKSKVDTTIDATRFGPACSQFGSVTPSIYTEDAPEFNIYPSEYVSEDCLSLSVWTPKRCLQEESQPLPVIVWIYGGGFVEGGYNVPYQNPTPWVQRSKKHIVVSVNYRLNIFGFPNAVGLPLEKQNLGLLDQRLALEWVRDNIAKFGGDSKRIVLMGQSAGGMSSDYYNFAYPEDPIVSGFILHSGNALFPFGNPDTSHTNFTYVANHFGCNSTGGGAQLDCLRNVNASSLTSFLRDDAASGAQPPLTFTPIYDNFTDFSNYTDRTLAGKFSRKPAIIGSTTNEGVAFLAYNKTFGPPQEEADAVTREVVNCPAVQNTKNRYAVNATTFRYLYAGNFSNISPRWWEGAYHSADLPLVFGTYGIARGNGTEFEKQVSEKMQDYWVAFAEDPVNGLPKLGWNSYAGGKGSAMLIGQNGTAFQPLAESYFEQQCQ